MNIKTTTLLALAIASFIGNAHAAETADGKTDKNDDKATRACMFASQPNTWTVLDDRQLVLWGPTQKDAYLVKLFSPLNDLRFSETVAFIDGDHNGMICGNGGDKIAVGSSTIPSLPSTITYMRKIDDAELLALSEKYKVKLLSDKKAQAVKQHDKQIHDQPAESKAE
ncbi:MAG: DUF6491 family protein [Steroidobacteraceae bacterium]